MWCVTLHSLLTLQAAMLPSETSGGTASRDSRCSKHVMSVKATRHHHLTLVYVFAFLPKQQPFEDRLRGRACGEGEKGGRS